jgi:heat shock protein HtpX
LQVDTHGEHTVRDEVGALERRSLGRDWGLSFRMGICLVLLTVLYFPFFLWLVAMGYFIWGGFAAALVAVGSLALLAATPYLSERLALGLARAEPYDEAARQRVEPLLARLCGLADMPLPRFAVMPTLVPNAFSAGRGPANAIVVVTRGLLDWLDDEELEAVLAHELAHIANRDAFVMTLAAAPALLGRKVLWGFVTLPVSSAEIQKKILAAMALLYLLPVVFVGWIVYTFATLLVMSISRYREYVADRGAVVLTGAPEQLMSALQKIADEVSLIPKEDLRHAAAMNAFFVLPATSTSTGFEVDPLRMFPTHPPLARRLERLDGVARSLGRARGMPDRPGPIAVEDDAKAPENPQAVGAFILAFVLWGALAGALLSGPEDLTSTSVWVPLLASAAVMIGIVLGFQGVGRASAGASGMGYAVTALVLLLGPWVLAVFAVVLVALLAVLGVGPPG